MMDIHTEKYRKQKDCDIFNYVCADYRAGIIVFFYITYGVINEVEFIYW